MFLPLKSDNWIIWSPVEANFMSVTLLPIFAIVIISAALFLNYCYGFYLFMFMIILWVPLSHQDLADHKNL